MDGENNCPPFIREAPQDFDDGECSKRIKTRGWFVQEQDTRVSEDLYCDRDTPLLATTDAFDKVAPNESVRTVLQPELEQHRLGPFDLLLVTQEWW